MSMSAISHFWKLTSYKKCIILVIDIYKIKEIRSMTITNDIRYIGVNDHQVDLFEGQYVVPNGMAYNSYAIVDEKIAIMDTVDRNFTEEWLGNITAALEGRKPDYLIVQHMEPDHSANIANFMAAYPEATIVSSARAFTSGVTFFQTVYIPHAIADRSSAYPAIGIKSGTISKGRRKYPNEPYILALSPMETALLLST